VDRGHLGVGKHRGIELGRLARAFAVMMDMQKIDVAAIDAARRGD
jgi:hypothetical protein